MKELTLEEIDGTGWEECPAPGCERYVGHSLGHSVWRDGFGEMDVYTVMPHPPLDTPPATPCPPHGEIDCVACTCCEFCGNYFEECMCAALDTPPGGG